MDKPATPKKKGNKLMRKFFRWKPDKTKTAENKRDKQSTKSRSRQPLTDVDEDSWERIRNMEQTRQISAMKNHITKLQSKLDTFENHNNNKNNNTETLKSPGSSDKEGGGAQKMPQKSEKFTERSRKLTIPDEDSQDSGEEILVYVDEEESNPREGSSRDFSPPIKVAAPNAIEMNSNDSSGSAPGVKDPTLEKKSDTSEEEVACASEGPSYLQSSSEEIVDGISQDDAIPGKLFDSKTGVDDAAEDETEDELPNKQIQIDSSEQGNTGFVASEFDNRDGSRSVENLSSDKAMGTEDAISFGVGGSDESICEVDSPRDYSEARRGLQDDNADLTMVNVELRGRITELEEQVWLAAEDKRNMQAMLEVQKERALKNLAFKFQDINKKTLCELKGIFEYRLQELNEEKLKLQEKLDNHRCGQAQGTQLCQNCVTRESDVQMTAKKCTKLAEENTVLKKRCRKLSGDLGKVKKAIGALQVAEENLVNEKGTQTECFVKLQDAATQCQGSLETSIYDLHDDVKAIAASVTSLSSHFLVEQKHWVDNSCSQSFSDDSPSHTIMENEELRDGIPQASAGKASSEHDATDLEDDGIVSCSENSCNSEKSGDSQTEGSKSSTRLTDDVDSGFFSNDISEYEIDKHLDKIHEKYTRISAELDDYEKSKLRLDRLESKPKPWSIPATMFKLDPEIMQMVADVNRQYDEYFKKKVVL